MTSEKPRLFLTDRSSWEITKTIRNSITPKTMRKLFGKSKATINRWCQPPTNADTQPGPIKKIQRLVSMLEKNGELELAVDLLNFFAAPIDHRTLPTYRPCPDKKTIEEECLDDYPEKTKLDDLVRTHAHPAIVRRQAEVCKREIDETLVKYEEYYEELENSPAERVTPLAG